MKKINEIEEWHEEHVMYKVELIGGEHNGRKRYYETLGIARREARRYRKRQLVKNGERTYYSIWKVDTYTGKKMLIMTEEDDNKIHTTSLR